MVFAPILKFFFDCGRSGSTQVSKYSLSKKTPSYTPPDVHTQNIKIEGKMTSLNMVGHTVTYKGLNKINKLIRDNPNIVIYSITVNNNKTKSTAQMSLELTLNYGSYNLFGGVHLNENGEGTMEFENVVSLEKIISPEEFILLVGNESKFNIKKRNVSTLDDDFEDIKIVSDHEKPPRDDFGRLYKEGYMFNIDSFWPAAMYYYSDVLKKAVEKHTSNIKKMDFRIYAVEGNETLCTLEKEEFQILKKFVQKKMKYVTCNVNSSPQDNILKVVGTPFKTTGKMRTRKNKVEMRTELVVKYVVPDRKKYDHFDSPMEKKISEIRVTTEEEIAELVTIDDKKKTRID